MVPSFTSIFRFRDPEGTTHYEEAGSSKNHTKESLSGREVRIFNGHVPWDSDFTLTDSTRTVTEVLCPLAHTPIFQCIGLNYKQHADEAGMPYGQYPVVFTKPSDAMAGPFEAIPVPAPCLNMDYEAELCLVVGKDVKNFNTEKDNVSDFILGFTVGNDVSSRYWQNPERSGNQHGTAKSFDKFAPIGPVITAPSAMPELGQVRLQSFVNGQERQSTLCDDLIFDLPAILAHLSRGTTVRKGTVIMTGTPSGVAAFMKPPAWLKNGDVVEVHLENVGTTRNEFKFEATS